MNNLIATVDYDNDLKEHSNMATHALDICKGLKSDVEYKIACDFLLIIKEKVRAWDAKIAPSIKTAHQLHRQLNDLKNEIAAPLVKAEVEVLKPAILKYERHAEECRRVEQERIARELKKLEESRRLEWAMELERSGKNQEADAVLNAPPPDLPVVLPKTTDHKGISYRTVYSAEVVDIKALCRAVADGVAPSEYVQANMPALNSDARNLKESLSPQWERIGLRVKSEKTVAVGGR